MATSSAVKVTGNDIIMPVGGKVDGVDVSVDVPAAQATADAAAAATLAHGSRHAGGGADAIASAVAAGAAGLMTGADKTKLDGIAAGANVTGANAPQAHATTHLPGGSDDANPIAAGAALTDADQTLQWSTTQGFHRMAAGTTTATRAKTLGVTNPVAGSTYVLDFYSQGNDVTIINGGSGAGTIDTITAGTKVRYVARYDGVNWTKGARMPLA